MKIKGFYIFCLVFAAFCWSACGTLRNPISASQAPKLYPIIQNSGPNTKFGYINSKGEIVIHPQFTQAWFFSEGLAVACVESEKCGYIDETGKFAINPQFQFASRFSEGLAGVIVADKIGYIDKTGKYVINPQFDFAKGPDDWQAIFSIFSEGLASVKVGGKTGYIDKTGKIVINPQFEMGLPFMEGLAAAKIGDKWGFVDKEGKIVINPQFERAQPFVSNLAAVKIGNQWGYIDKAGKIVINPQFEFAAPFASEGAAVVFLKDKAGYIDREGKYLVNPQFSIPPDASRLGEIALVAAFTVTSDLGRLSSSEGLALANVGGTNPDSTKFGYVNETGQFTINPQFTLASPFYGELALVMVDRTRFAWIDKEGKIVWQQTIETPKPASNANVSNTNRPPNSYSSSSNSNTATNTAVNAMPDKTGRLTTDSNIRSEPNKDAASLGIHFKGARMKIIDQTSFQVDSGETSTWYKVRVTDYGCSVRTELGCGKNSPNDSDEGWVNAKNVLID